MQRLTENVYTETKIRGCKPSIVMTREGSVFIDTAQWITALNKMRAFALERGPIKALINHRVPYRPYLRESLVLRGMPGDRP
jgi:hypothetical protein